MVRPGDWRAERILPSVCVGEGPERREGVNPRHETVLQWDECLTCCDFVRDPLLGPRGRVCSRSRVGDQIRRIEARAGWSCTDCIASIPEHGGQLILLSNSVFAAVHSPLRFARRARRSCTRLLRIGSEATGEFPPPAVYD